MCIRDRMRPVSGASYTPGPWCSRGRHRNFGHHCRLPAAGPVLRWGFHRPEFWLTRLGALHLTGVVLVIALPGAGRAGAVDAGRVPGRSGRPWRRLAWLVSFDQLLVADRVVTDGELEYSQEDQSAAA